MCYEKLCVSWMKEPEILKNTHDDATIRMCGLDSLITLDDYYHLVAFSDVKGNLASLYSFFPTAFGKGTHFLL